MNVLMMIVLFVDHMDLMYSPRLPPYPDEWQVFLSHRQLGASSHRLNSLFSLTALGVYDGDFMHFKSGVAAVTLNGGRIYHRLIPAQEGQHAI